MVEYHECIVFLLAKAYQKAHGNLKRRLGKYGLTPIQTLILAALWEEEGLPAGEIGKRLVLDNATLSGVLDRLADKGWIHKEPDPYDKRVVRIYLDIKGKAQKERLLHEREKTNQEVLRDFTLEEKVLLKRLLREVKG